MDNFILNKASSVEIFDNDSLVGSDSCKFSCLFHWGDNSKFLQTFSLSATSEAFLMDTYQLSDDTVEQSNSRKLLELDLTSTLGKFIFRKYLQDDSYRKIPEPVQDVISYITELRLPVVLGPNIKPTLEGCYDAAKVRKHLVNAQEYMPIYDELKSILFLIGKGDKQYYVVSHCRGNREFDEKKISLFLKERFQLSGKQAKYVKLLGNEELQDKFLLEKGRVTPFIPTTMVNEAPVIHIFDSDCMRSYGMPMMTNANHSDWATEFVGEDLINCFVQLNPNRYFVHQIVRGETSGTLDSLSKYNAKVLGVVEYGLPAATIFRSKLNQYSKEYMLNLEEYAGKDSEEEYIKLVHAGTFSEFSQYAISSPEFEKVMEPDLYGSVVTDKLSETINKFEYGGCNIIAVPCNILPHYISSNTSVLSITVAVEKALSIKKGNGLFLGGRSVNDLARSIYRNKFVKDINERLTYLSLDEAEAIDEAMMAVNIGDNEQANRKMFDVLSSYVGNIDFLVVASTSLSVFLSQQSSILDSEYINDISKHGIVSDINNLEIIDTLSAYAEYCAMKLFN